MPYIKQVDRDLIDMDSITPENPGQLNYLLTQVCREYLEVKDKSYQTFNDIVGALESCKLEFYRRMISPYEDKKIQENGDVFS